MVSTQYTKLTWVETTAPAICSSNLNHLETQYDCSVIIGEVKLFSGTTAEMPDTFLLCNGTSYAVASYAALFAVTSNRYGGDSTYFNVPNMQGVFPLGYSSVSYATVGATGGSSEITLASSQMPAHTHTYPYYTVDVTGVSTAHPNTALNPSQIFTGNFLTGSAGETAAHNNVPPYVVLSYIIRYR